MSWILVRANFEPLPPDLSIAIETFRSFGVDNTLEDGHGLQGCIVEVDGATRSAEDLKTALEAIGASSVSISPYVEQDWEIAWKQFFKPRRVGKRFLVVPSWEPVEAGADDLVLVLDPGQAFGTGDHPTTRMCLELLEPLDLVGKSLADVGCGSGILAIGAAKLGANVLAVDIDPIALEVAVENAQRNRVVLDCYCGDGLKKLEGLEAAEALATAPQDDTPLAERPPLDRSPLPEGSRFDVIVSNIISATLIRLGQQLTRSLNTGGTWIVSGIIEDNWREVESAAIAMGMVLKEVKFEDGWVAGSFFKVSLA
jgi:ribosomal protein L11 methyltransferase